jgi:hypothetical protein
VEIAPASGDGGWRILPSLNEQHLLNEAIVDAVEIELGTLYALAEPPTARTRPPLNYR